MRDLQEVFDSFKMDIHLNNHKKWFTPILESFIKHNYLEISERRCLNYLPGHEPALPAASLPVISSPADISLPTPAKGSNWASAALAASCQGKVGGEGVQPAPLSGGADQSMPNSKIMQSPSPALPISINPQSVTVASHNPALDGFVNDMRISRELELERLKKENREHDKWRLGAETVCIGGHSEQSKAVSSEVVGDSYPGTLSEMKAVLVAEEWPRECKVKVYGVCGNLRLMVGELEDGRRVSFWKGVRNWRINDWVPCRLDRGGGAPVYLPV